MFGLWFQFLPMGAPVSHLPPLPANAHITMGKGTSTDKQRQTDCTGRSNQVPSELHLRRMINGFHLAREGEIESYLQYGCRFEGTIQIGQKTFLVDYEPRENLGTTWPDAKYHILYGPNPDCCDDDPSPLTRRQRARLKWYGLKP